MIRSTRSESTEWAERSGPCCADGLFYDVQGGTKLLIGQAVAAAVTILYAAIVSFVLLKLIDATIGLRVSQQAELQGLDITEHGEEGYTWT